jgi:hypothetical protein
VSKVNIFGLRSLVGAGAITAVAAIGLASMGAGTAAARPLPSGSKVTQGVDGAVVKISRTGEAAHAVPSLTNDGAGRAAEVSGLVTVTAGEASGTLTTGYIVGCQVDITGLEGGLNTAIDSSPTRGADGSLTVPLAPGEAAFVPLGNKSFEGGLASVQYTRQGIEVQQCGGYAQARAFTTVQTEGNYVIKSTLYGAPFSLN